MSLNKVMLIGNVGQEPIIRSTQDGKKIANISLATSEKWQNKNTGEFHEKTEWHKVVIFSDGLAGVVEKYVHKGAKLYVEGALETRKYTDKNGVEKYSTEVILKGFGSKIDILGNGQNINSDEILDAVNDVMMDDSIPF